MSAISIPKFLVGTLQFAGPFFAVGMQAAALDTTRKIFMNRSTGKLSPLPFISLFTNCVVWTYYGILIKDMSVTVPNGVGVLAGIISSGIFQLFADFVPLKEYAAALAVVALATYYFFEKKSLLVGYLGCALSVILMGSPLATLKTVIQSKNTESLPLGTSLVTFGNALSWASYGFLVAHDQVVSILLTLIVLLK